MDTCKDYYSHNNEMHFSHSRLFEKKKEFNKDKKCHKATSAKVSPFFTCFSHVACLVLTKSVPDMTLSVNNCYSPRALAYVMAHISLSHWNP